jgi:hypothetical protein
MGLLRSTEHDETGVFAEGVHAIAQLWLYTTGNLRAARRKLAGEFLWVNVFMRRFAAFILCENSDAMKNEWFQEVLSSFAQATCLTARPFFHHAEGRGLLRRVEPERRCLPARSAHVGFAAYHRKALRRASLVVSQQTAQTLLADNLAHMSIRLHQGRLGPTQRPIAQPLMGTKLVVVDQILGQDVSQMRFAENDEVTEALVLDGRDMNPPFAGSFTFPRCLCFCFFGGPADGAAGPAASGVSRSSPTRSSERTSTRGSSSAPTTRSSHCCCRGSGRLWTRDWKTGAATRPAHKNVGQ